jgi:hypothetical protein
LKIKTWLDKEIYVAPRTYYYFLQKLAKCDLGEDFFATITKAMSRRFHVPIDRQRLDSVHVKSNMKEAGRLCLMMATVKSFLKPLGKLAGGHRDSLDAELLARYLGKKDDGEDYFGIVKPTMRQAALSTVANDMLAIINKFESVPEVASMEKFKLMVRVFGEQCTVVSESKIEVSLKTQEDVESSVTLEMDDDSDPDCDDLEPVVEASEPESSEEAAPLVALMKDPKDVRSDSVQYPSDPDATYSAHKGKGYHVQIAETYTPIEDQDSNTLNLITYVEVHGAHQSDNGAVETSLTDLVIRDMAPKVLMADTAYGSDANYEFARGLGVELVAPVPGQEPGAKAAKAKAKAKAAMEISESVKLSEEAKARSFASGYDAEMALEFDECRKEVEGGPLKLSDFGSSPRGEILNCPMGHEAVSRRNSADNGGRAYFDRETCNRCPRRGDCPLNFSGEFPHITYKDEQVRIACRRAYQATHEFKDRYRMRSGIEATNSQLERLGLKKLPVRGLDKVALKVFLKALALNIHRVTRYFKKNTRLLKQRVRLIA